MNSSNRINRALSFFVMLAILSTPWLTSAQPARAATSPIRYLAGFASNSLFANDDESTSAVPIGFTVNFFGKQHSTLYVNNNGNITFDASQYQFTPYDLTSTTREIVAAFFADVDTRGLGSALVTYGNDSVDGHTAFGVNYVNVGYFTYHVDKLNSFQLILIDRSDIGPGDFDIEFNYEKIQWETGDASGGIGGFGGASARVGFSNGTGAAGTFFELPGSAVNGAFLDDNFVTGLIYNNYSTGTPGRYHFEARNGIINITHNPLILVPGITGSKLLNDPNQDGIFDEVWPNAIKLLADPNDGQLQVLKLDSLGTGPYDPNDPKYATVRVGPIIRRELQTLDFYDSTIKFFTEQRNYTLDQDFFVCPYDWRKHIPYIATGGLVNTLDDCINTALSQNPGKTKVDILAHSMGGLVARYYVSDANRAQKVGHLVTLGTPYLGAPKIATALIDKMCFIDALPGTCWVNQATLHDIVQNFPSAYEISPGESYFQLYPEGYIYRDWDKNKDGTVDGWLDYAASLDMLKAHNETLALQAQDNYYNSAGGWSNGGTNGVNVLMIVGSGLSTPLYIEEKQESDWWDPYHKRIVYSVLKVDGGDTSVPLRSANLRDPFGVDLSANVSTVYFHLAHGDLPTNTQVLQVAASFFESGQNVVASLKNSANPQLKDPGAVKKETGTSSSLSGALAPQLAGPSLDPTPLEGQYLTFEGDAILEVIDQFGNRIGLTDEGGAYEVNIPGASFYPLDHAYSVFLPNDRTYFILVDGQARTEGLVKIQKYANNNIEQTTVYEPMMLGANSNAWLNFDPNAPAGSFFLDLDGDGSVDDQTGVAAVLDSQQSTDNIAPKTNIDIQGTPLGNGWYAGSVTVTITAQDDPGGVGVNKIEYSFDGGQTITEYTGPFSMNASLHNQIMARAIDFAGNSSWQTACACADIDVLVGGENQGTYGLPIGASIRQSYDRVNNGPVELASTNNRSFIAAERVIYKAAGGIPTSFSEMMALPNSQLDSTYWLPWYNNVDLDTQLRFGNVSNSTATVHVYVGTQEMNSGIPGGSPYILQPGESLRVSFPNINNGPVRIVSNMNIVAAERVIYKINGKQTSFSEMMALPNTQLTSTYWLPWYNNADLDTQLRFGNVSNSTATVHVYIGTHEMNSSGSPYTLQPGQSLRVSFPNVNQGPVKIVSNVNIVAAERVIYKVNGTNTSFSEMMALSNGQLNATYWLPWYNNVDLDTQLRFGNVSSSPATVHVYIGDVEMANSPFILLPGASTRQSFAVNNGPVKIVSNVNIVAAERVIYKVNGTNTSFSEVMALPNSQLDTAYWLPWYNNVDLDTQLRFGVP